MEKQQFTVQDLESIFNQLFEKNENTQLRSGGEEPIYLPSSKAGKSNIIVSTQDYFSSALHEVSHWCVAGAERRKLVDYGYWYEPDGRSEEQQRLFEQVEIKPQALEWIFTTATNQKFNLSIDNVNQPEMKASDDFRYNVYTQVVSYLQGGLPERAEKFLNSLLAYYQKDISALSVSDFRLEDLY